MAAVVLGIFAGYAVTNGHDEHTLRIEQCVNRLKLFQPNCLVARGHAFNVLRELALGLSLKPLMNSVYLVRQWLFRYKTPLN